MARIPVALAPLSGQQIHVYSSRNSPLHTICTRVIDNIQFEACHNMGCRSIDLRRPLGVSERETVLRLAAVLKDIGIGVNGLTGPADSAVS
jgi:hypothetical protein